MSLRLAGQGGKSLAERAAERVVDILAEHQPEPLPEDVFQKIKAIVRQAEDRAGNCMMHET